MAKPERGTGRLPEISVNKERLLANFQTLVEIDSPTGEEAEMSGYLMDWFERRGLKTEQDSKLNVFTKIPGIGEPLFLSAHMDTVEPGRGIKPKVRQGTIKSDGRTILGADNKSTIAVMLETIDLLSGKDHRPLEILFTVDEESTNSGAIEFDFSRLSAKEGLIADIAEPIGTIVLASPAYIRFDARLIGHSAHAAYPENAVNVLDALGQILRIPKGQLDPVTTLNIGLVQAGTSRNTIPGEANISGELRSYDEVLLEKNLNQTLDKIRRAAVSCAVGLSLEQKKDNPGYVFEEDDPFVKSIADIMTATRIKPRFIWNPSCSDANIFNSRGLQVVNVGDGTLQTHTTGESIKLKDMIKLVNIFHNFARQGIDKA